MGKSALRYFNPTGTAARTRLAKLGYGATAYIGDKIRQYIANSNKRSRTRTRTRTRRKRRKNNFRVMHGTAYTKHVVFWKPKKYLRNAIKNTSWFTYQWDNAANLVMPAGYDTGVQAYQNPMIPICNPWFIRYKSSATQEGLRKNIFVKSVKVRFMISNQTTANAVVSLYAFYAKKDLPNNDQYSEPFAHWGEGLTNAGNNNGYLHPSSSPLLSKKCRENWGVEKKWIWNLQGGETITVDYIYFPNRLIKGQTLEELTPNSSATYSQSGSFKGITRYLGVVAHGTPVESVTTADNITTSAVQLPWTASMEITTTTLDNVAETMANWSTQAYNIVQSKNVQPGDQEVANVVVP